MSDPVFKDRELRIVSSSMKIERRSGVVDGKEAEGVTLRGHAALFDDLSEPMWGFREKIDPGAFTESLKGDVRALLNHDSNIVLGRSTNNTLRMVEDADGLAVEIDINPNDRQALDVAARVERGDISQMSFGFTVDEQRWDENVVEGSDDLDVIRTIIKVRSLYDVSPVTYPAYAGTDVSKRALLAEHRASNEVEAKKVLARGRKQILAERRQKIVEAINATEVASNK